MENKRNFFSPFIVWIQIVFLIIAMIFLVGFTIYIQQPDPIEINQIAFAGREIIHNNNKYAIDLFKWAPGYTDQVFVEIDNNTNKDTTWSIYVENLENVDFSLLESIGVYIKENPTSWDVLQRYDSPITEGYKYYGNLAELKYSKFIEGFLDNEKDNTVLSILFHVAEDSTIKETEFEFRNVLKIRTETDGIFTDKILE